MILENIVCKKKGTSKNLQSRRTEIHKSTAGSPCSPTKALLKNKNPKNPQIQRLFSVYSPEAKDE